MRNEHILDILDEKAFGELSETELSKVRSHSEQCASCFQAFEAARISSVLLKVRAEEVAVPSPFFQTRVMANLREKQARTNPFAVLLRMWRASSSLVVMMVTVVLGLVLLTVLAPDYDRVSSASVSTIDSLSTDMVIVNGRLPGREPTTEQVFQIIYDGDVSSRRERNK